MASVEATTQQKRQREETQNPELSENKKPKSSNHILSFLDDDEDEPGHDISSLISSLQQEISSSESESAGSQLAAAPSPSDREENPSTVPVNSEDSPSPTTSSVLNEDDKERVMRHLLEASDDELGIPTAGADRFDGYEVSGEFGDGFVLCDGLWEFEDEAANYYTLLQSELFM